MQCTGLGYQYSQRPGWFRQSITCRSCCSGSAVSIGAWGRCSSRSPASVPATPAIATTVDCCVSVSSSCYILFRGCVSGAVHFLGSIGQFACFVPATPAMSCHAKSCLNRDSFDCYRVVGLLLWYCRLAQYPSDSSSCFGLPHCYYRDT
jgi:hypothetical protein